MVYDGTYETEIIMVHPMDDLDENHYIEIFKSPNEAYFYVTCCCDDDWMYEFEYNKSDYERIKYNIMEAIFECDTMKELLDTLSEIFDDGFAPICEDDSCDEKCNCKNCECFEKC